MAHTRPPLGLYQHFKGEYFFLMNILRDSAQDCKGHLCQYFNVLRPDYGYFARPIEQWFEDVSKRKDNVTGQRTRFQQVLSIDTSMKNFTTEQLVRELSVRRDSPLQALDIEGLSSMVASADYVIGEVRSWNNDECVTTYVAFTTEEEAKKYYENHKFHKGIAVYKRTFIKVV